MKKATEPMGPAALRMKWVPVTLPDGRSRMEMRWKAPRKIQKATAA
ncbi:MAG TPA: hypothetical protein PLP55_13570 [Phycicoccus elongatus]|jgi:hypothetical protein|uniref:Uncharacterized protein n=1 Tax=Phycicoccus elongatus Lp2 TaxID=1193181 RepID=N0E207_9MICO|nr:MULTISPECIES: hypothetical protein [Phycicoccus]MBK8728249.1 hypothetical protein [Tetrasphaera sp.]MCA0323701.1 hypothetical protein [Actinomycetota bacterium]MCB1239383.1 hypothetical protein [Tetrasphaera sp.]MCB9405136.1 hypothetical protein [Tetrasphaera sp.]MCO5304198.1 hypothetical protein [Phycicoccus sp.]